MPTEEQLDISIESQLEFRMGPSEYSVQGSYQNTNRPFRGKFTGKKVGVIFIDRETRELKIERDIDEKK